MQLKYTFLLIVCAALLYSSCFKVVVGYHSPKILTEKQLTQYEKQLGITHTHFNTDKYILYMKHQNESIKKRMYQPCQILVFKKDTLKKWVVNCDVGGFPKLHWQIPSLLRKDRSGTFSDNLSYIYTTTVKTSFKEQDTTVLVFWSRVLNKTSKQLIKEVQKHTRKTAVKVCYCNLDSFFVALDKNTEIK
ncbi:MAG: hypothetical protein NZ455_14760 [Bacteroidia bacterium]|nr:hypothetical protein [Bacteroidia bacterium]MDW8346858.1 hypothetical protein [Bacteroidia bacterium]